MSEEGKYDRDSIIRSWGSGRWGNDETLLDHLIEKKTGKKMGGYDEKSFSYWRDSVCEPCSGGVFCQGGMGSLRAEQKYKRAAQGSTFD